MSFLNRRHFIKQTLAALSAIPVSGFYTCSNATNAVENTSQKPAALQPGDTIGVISPAGAVYKPKYITDFQNIIKREGFQCKLGDTLYKQNGFLAGTDKERADELNHFFADASIKAIICMRGGWGGARILPLINYAIIARNPKIFMGFSDITSLLIGIYKKTGLITFHGPVGYSSWGRFTTDYFRRVLIDKDTPVFKNPSNHTIYSITTGNVRGKLIGGNLSVISSIIGSAYEPNWHGKILFLEETEEEPYRIDRMLTQLALRGVLKSISGFIFGKCVSCYPEKPHQSLTFEQVLLHHIKPLGIPAFYGAMTGHIRNKYTLPIGIPVRMNADKGTITMLASAVK